MGDVHLESSAGSPQRNEGDEAKDHQDDTRIKQPDELAISIELLVSAPNAASPENIRDPLFLRYTLVHFAYHDEGNDIGKHRRRCPEATNDYHRERDLN